tara:strand:+ start:361 stop:885 length:525 start_codon:yes stop_codon:yes gene_type:complete
MTSLGNYASASVLKCNNLICDTLTANNLKSIYGQFDLSENVLAQNSLTTIGNWKPTSILKNVAVLAGANGNEKFYVTEVGLYKVGVNLAIDNGSDNITRCDCTVVFYPGAIAIGGSVTQKGGGANWIKETLNLTAQFEITDPTTQYIEIEGRVSGTGTPSYTTNFTQVFIKKIA